MHKSQIKSQTTPCLYQHPTAENTVVYKGWIGNLFALLVMGILLCFTVYVMLIAADREAVIKTQNQAQTLKIQTQSLNSGEIK